MSDGSITYPVDLGIIGQVDAEIDYTYTAGSPATFYARNGDPGNPAEPCEVKVLSIEIDGQKISGILFDKLKEHLEADDDLICAIEEQESEITFAPMRRYEDAITNFYEDVERTAGVSND